MSTRRERNNNIENAIDYVKSRGNGDPVDAYYAMLQRINNGILVLYGAEPTVSYDSRAFLELDGLVKEQLEIIQQRRLQVEAESHQQPHTPSRESEYELPPGDGNVTTPQKQSTTEPKQSYPTPKQTPNKPNPSIKTTKGPVPPVKINPIKGPNISRGPVTPVTKMSNTEPRPPVVEPADVPAASTRTPFAPQTPSARTVEKQWVYGGPGNHPEQWLKTFPPTLPFGETLHMQEWDSRKIAYDLAESAKITDPNADPVLITNVPFETITMPRGGNPYDSGSRFTLPQMQTDPEWAEWFQPGDRTAWLDTAVQSFNQGGCPDAQVFKDYTPRIFLPRITANHTQDAVFRKPAPPADSQVTPTAAPNTSTGGGVSSALQRGLSDNESSEPTPSRSLPKRLTANTNSLPLGVGGQRFQPAQYDTYSSDSYDDDDDDDDDDEDIYINIQETAAPTLLPPSNIPSSPTSALSRPTKAAHKTKKTGPTEISAPRKRGRPQGSKNKKTSTGDATGRLS